MNDITPKEAIEILSHYTDLGYGIVIEGDDVSKIIQALSLARKTLAKGTPYNPTGKWVDQEYRRYLPRDAEPGYNDDTYDEKTHSVVSTHIVCSKCGAERHFYHNFCGECGADMRKGGVE